MQDNYQSRYYAKAQDLSHDAKSGSGHSGCVVGPGKGVKSRRSQGGRRRVRMVARAETPNGNTRARRLRLTAKRDIADRVSVPTRVTKRRGYGRAAHISRWP